jgi:hypothetical protein
MRRPITFECQILLYSADESSAGAQIRRPHEGGKLCSLQALPTQLWSGWLPGPP